MKFHQLPTDNLLRGPRVSWSDAEDSVRLRVPDKWEISRGWLRRCMAMQVNRWLDHFLDGRFVRYEDAIQHWKGEQA
jgi:hypothetical protein